MSDSVRLKALRLFTDHVPGRGIVVFNKGSVDTLPADKAAQRVKSGFAVEVEDDETTPTPSRMATRQARVVDRSRRGAKRKTKAQKRATAKPAKADAEAPPEAKPKRGRGRPPKPTEEPRTATPSDAPVD